MSAWLKYFFGTPKRFVSTAVCIGIIIVILNPQILAMAVNSLLIGITPLLGPALAILIVMGGVKMMLK